MQYLPDSTSSVTGLFVSRAIEPIIANVTNPAKETEARVNSSNNHGISELEKKESFEYIILASYQ